MEILKFLSFGRWDIALSENDSNAAVVLFTIYITCLLIKLVVINIEYFSTVSYKFKFNVLACFLFLFYVSLYILPLFIIALFLSKVIYFVLVCIIILTMVISGLHFVIEEKNLFPLDEIVCDFIENVEEKLYMFEKKKDKIKEINKKIYEYRKKSI